MSTTVDEETEEDWEADLSAEFNHLNCRAMARQIIGAAATYEELKSTFLLFWGDQSGWFAWFNGHHCARCGACNDQLNTAGLCLACQGPSVLAA